MSELGRAVTERLKGQVPETEVDDILRQARVTASAAVPTPVRLHVRSVGFSGMKSPQPAQDVGATAASVDELGVREPFEFSWELGPGLYVVGSHENLRGKSSVLEIIRWALRGRCRLQADIRSWLRQVQVVFAVGGETLTVEFAVRDGQPDGAVYQGTGAGRVELVRFDGEDAFEQAMDAVMMTRLHLQRISAWQDKQAVEHAWVAYAGALAISSRGLDFLLGDQPYSGMAARLLSMFLGAAWAGSRTEATTALRGVDAALEQLDGRTRQREKDTADQRAAAQASVTIAQTELAALPDGGERLTAIEAAVGRVGTLGAEVAQLRAALADARAAEQEVARQLQEERARRHAVLEDALSRRFFNALRPTACPRCAAPVSKDRREQEAAGHECSVCTTELDLEALHQEVLVAASAPQAERDAALRSATMPDPAAGSEDAPAEGEDALRRALTGASSEVGRLTTRLQMREAEWQEVTELARSGGDLAGLVARRRDAELALARAQGALDALRTPATAEETAQREVLERRKSVLKAAEKVTTTWVHEAQQDTLRALSTQIAGMARAFGVSQLESVELDGAARLRVRKGGVETPYSRCTPGEQLRLKVATAVALLRAGFSSQVGRHPGLLTVDSPGSEEATTESLDTMLHALTEAAADAPQMQVIVATTRTELLEEIVPPDRRRVAPPGGYLW